MLPEIKWQTFQTNFILHFYFWIIQERKKSVYITVTEYSLLLLTILRKVVPHVFGLAHIAAVEDAVADDDTIWLQWGAPAHQHRR